MKKPDVVRKAIDEFRKRQAPAIDGSYVCLSQVALNDYAAAAHPAYTPEQIEAERKARGMGIAKFVYFIRDEQMPAPYWISPVAHAMKTIYIEKDDKLVPIRVEHAVFTVARSRETRKREAVEVAIPLVRLAEMKDKASEYTLEQLRIALRAIVAPKIIAAA